MTPTRLGAKKELSKTDLEDWIADTEAAIGPLMELEVAEGGTVGTFDADGAGWTKRATIKLDPFQCDTGTTMVCDGEVYILSQIMKVRVCR